MVTRGEAAGQLPFGEVGNVDELKADGETLDERRSEEVHDEPSVFVHVVTARRASAVVGVGGGASCVDNQTPGRSTRRSSPARRSSSPVVRARQKSMWE
jgi:hypothetical protein